MSAPDNTVDDALVTHRDATPDDLNFIVDSWLRSYRTAPRVDRVPDDIYYVYHRQLFAHVLSRASVRMAVDPADPTHIYGYCVFEQPKDQPAQLHYVYVKRTFRQMGVARKLVAACIPSFGKDYVECTHRTNVYDALHERLNLRKRNLIISEVH